MRESVTEYSLHLLQFTIPTIFFAMRKRNVKFQEFQVLPGKNKFTDLRGLHAQKESKKNNYICRALLSLFISLGFPVPAENKPGDNFYLLLI